ncbi:uncharacterized protein LOC130675335 isoform X1 [Microplitis mediator]|uniref:uncharacterized protein LOC130675335 isoform X1 n=1 Tax=Microplitis mediator TaxID=375433 RepID=UPI00255415AB|nr:uncharacterized protein LOC130675335 isoform X1 [Microplitis mediator]
MGLLLSILVGCVGAIELLACLKHLTDEITITPAPCLSYHGPAMVENPSFHDSLCGISHSTDIRMPSSARNKLENLHEYSLRVRSELKSHGYADGSTLSELSSRDLRSVSRADSRLSLDFELIEKDADEPWQGLVDGTRDQLTTILTGIDLNDYDKTSDYDDNDDGYDDDEDDRLILEEIIEPDKLITEAETRKNGILKPVAIFPKNLSASSSSIDLSAAFENDSGNELPTKEHFRHVPVVAMRHNGESSSSAHSLIEDPRVCRKLLPKKSCIKNKGAESKSPDHSTTTAEITSMSFKEGLPSNENVFSVSNNDSVLSIDRAANGEKEIEERGTSPISHHNQKRQKVRQTSVLRKSTRLKSKNAEISKSAENLSSKKLTKRQRDPERRKSDISIQTTSSSEYYRDEWTNTSPTDSEKSMSTSRSSLVSVEVQTNFEVDDYNDNGNDVSGWKYFPPKSESKKDGWMKNGKRSFVSKRFPKSRSLDDHYTNESIEPDNSDRRLHYKETALRFRANNSRLEASTAAAVAPSNTITRDAETRNSWRPSIMQGSEEDSVDEEEFVDAEDESILQATGPIEYCIPSVESSKAFWLIFSGEYTKAMNKDWHSGHFCCWQCDESLTGQRYVLRDEHPYCIKCYESVFANGCEECNKIIGIDSKDLSYKDKHWHEACFLCNKCRVSLVDKQFGSKVDKIYCGNCYDAQFASRCDGCGEIFRAGTKKMEYKTRQWHEKCFCCVVCKNPIGTKSFIPREQEIYCAGCYEDKFATRCVKCNKIITSGGVTYKNEPWHRDCFTCSHCNNSLAGQRFTSRDDKPYCAECFGELFAKRCTACTKPITGIGGTRFISFEDRHWHNDCFICAGCKTSLVGRGFITDGDDIICPECAKQKLSE